MAGKSLTDAAIRQATPKERAYKLSDSGGLYLHITPAGGKLWRLKYRFGGKEKLLSLGKYPLVSLKAAREGREQAKSFLEQGIDPGAKKQEAKAAIAETVQAASNTFEAIANAWFTTYSPDLTEKHAIKLKRYIDKVFVPAFGKKPVADVMPKDILDAVQPYQEKKRIDTAHRVTQLAGQILQYAFIQGLVPVNVGKGISMALQPLRTKSFAAITEPEEIGRLLRAIDNYKGYASIVYYLKILPYVFCRPGELRLARWDEVDFEKNLLTISWERIKTRKISQKNHKIPLARQVVSLLHELKTKTDSSPFLFPSARAKTDTISDAGPLNALRDMGYPKEVMTLHGFRSMASTRLNEMGFRPDLIEAQLCHKDPDAVRAIYNRSEYLDERREMMQKWADYLIDLRNNG